MKKVFKIWALLLVSLLLAGVLSACGADATAVPGGVATATGGAGTNTTGAGASPTTKAAGAGADAGTITIYSSLPLTGSSKEQTETLVNAMKLALEDYTGGTNKIGNFTIKFTSLDDATAAKGQWDADQEKSNANKALNDPDGMVYIGTFNSGAAKVAIPILNQGSMVMLSPANTRVGLTRELEGITDKGEPGIYFPNPTRNYFRVVAADDLQGAAAVDFLKTLNAKKIYVIDDSQDYGRGLADGLQVYCKRGGLDCTKRVPITGKESDYSQVAADIKAYAPDAIYFAGITQQNPGKLLGDIRRANITVPFVGGDGISENAFIKDAGAAAKDAYASNAGTPAEKLPAKGQDFLTRYQAKFGKVEAYTIYGYECMAVALTAIKNAGKKDRKAILDAVANIKDFEGVLGKWSFTKDGDTTLTDFTFRQVRDNEWKYFALISPKL